MMMMIRRSRKFAVGQFDFEIIVVVVNMVTERRSVGGGRSTTLPVSSVEQFLVFVVFVDKSDGERVDDGVKSAGGADEQVMQRHVFGEHHGGRGDDEQVQSRRPEGAGRYPSQQTIHHKRKRHRHQSVEK